MLQSGELKNSNELISFLRQELSTHPENMTIKQQERIAASVVGLGVNDNFDNWKQRYPTLNKIFDMATDLEWSNLDPIDATSYWKTIRQLVDELYLEVMRYNKVMNEQALSDKQIEAEVAKLNVAWTHIPGEGLVRVFETDGFAEGLALVEEIGGVAERLTHYPEVTLRNDEVDVTAFTPEAGGVTKVDIDLAKAIDETIS